mmetsp:Transcript_2320/g.3580  ORF Transcript_2320/g.3580 Transcript_2320/m.3580 type:complete len:85 (-) Transcript_2320:493-747(-)
MWQSLDGVLIHLKSCNKVYAIVPSLLSQPCIDKHLTLICVGSTNSTEAQGTFLLICVPDAALSIIAIHSNNLSDLFEAAIINCK